MAASFEFDAEALAGMKETYYDQLPLSLTQRDIPPMRAQHSEERSIPPSSLTTTRHHGVANLAEIAHAVLGRAQSVRRHGLYSLNMPRD
jgi:hypothetical protein